MLDVFHLSLGLVSCFIVYKWSKHDLVSENSSANWIKTWFRFELYSIWLVKEIIVANIHVFKLAFSSQLSNVISPKMITFKTPIQSEMGQFILAQSITLTPGTVTARINENEFLIHAIDSGSADALPGEMQDRVASLYEEAV